MMLEMKVLAGILGAMIGSFLNVLIYRLPRDMDIVLARSACPHCGDRIPFYLNIPLVGFAVLRGKCRQCKGRIHWRYPVVEAVTAILFVVAFPPDENIASLYTAIFQCAVGCALIVHFFIDLEHSLLLDKINIYLVCLILPYTLIFNAPAFWISGALVGFGGPFLVSWAFYKLKGKVGLGGGDIKLWGVLGLFLGPAGILENIFFSSFLGSIVGLALIALKKYNSENGIPFGPYIIVVAFAQILAPELFHGLGLFSL